MKRIKLSNSKRRAAVDDSDFPLVSQYKWFLHATGCAMGWKGKKLRGIKMHRLIMGAPKGTQVDHIDHNKLNNQRSNLRLVNQSQNSYNMAVEARKRNGASSRFKGVSWDKSRQQWQVGIMQDYRRYSLGRFDSETEAAAAYNSAARQRFGEFACLNPV